MAAGKNLELGTHGALWVAGRSLGLQRAWVATWIALVGLPGVCLSGACLQLGPATEAPSASTSADVRPPAPVDARPEAIAHEGDAGGAEEEGAVEPPASGGNPGGGTRADLTPEIVTFEAAPARIAFLGSSTLSWRTERANACRISPEVGAVPPSGTATIGSGAPGTDTRYTLQCENDGRTARAEVTVATQRVVYTGDLRAQNAAALATLVGVNVVTGDVSISGAAGVYDLSTLTGLVEIEGTLAIEATPGLSTVSLPHLARIGDDLRIDRLGALTSLALPSLEAIGDRLYISRVPSLPSEATTALIQQVENRDGIGGAVLVYENAPDPVLSTLEQGFRCISQSGDRYYLLLYGNQGAGGELYLEREPHAELQAQGTYQVVSDALALQIPELGFAETTTPVQIEYDHAVSFRSPTFVACSAIETGLGDGLTEEVDLVCPRITYPLMGGYEDNRFQLRPHGSVMWERTVTAPGAAPVLIQQSGIYVFDDVRIHFAFGLNEDPYQLMSGTLSFDNQRMLIDELAPERGPCTPP